MAAAGGGGGLGTGGKIRSRRYHVSSGRTPYSKSRQQQSIISRVTDTVKSIVPSWLQKYFNKVDEVPGVSRSTNEVEEHVEIRQNVDDQFVDEDRSSLDGRVIPQSDHPSTSHQITVNIPDVLTRPSLHRANLNFNILDSPALNCQPSTSSAFPIGSSGFSLIKEIKDSTSLHDDDNISTTSGFSSRASDKDVAVTKTGHVPLLWSPEADRSQIIAQNSSMNSKRPAFNPSAFASLLPSLDKTSSRLGDSPFYPGKTTYGGAAAFSSKVRSTPYQAPVKKQVKAKPAHNQSCGVTSLAARRILQSLEKMSSPLADAKRIPSVSSPDSPMTTKRSFLSAADHASKRKKSDSSYPPVQKLVTPQSISVSSGLMKKIRPSLASSMLSNSSNCRTLSTDKHKVKKRKDVPDSTPQQDPQSFSYPNFSTPASNGFASGKGGGKMMRERGDRGSTKPSEEDIEVPHLPDIPLPISMKALPKFSLNIEPKSITSPLSKPVSTKAPEEVKSHSAPPPAFIAPMSSAMQPPSSTDSSGFKFSQPLVKSTSFAEQSTASSVDFTFSAPALKTSFPLQSNTTSKRSSPAKVPSLMNSSVTKTTDEEDYGGCKPAETLKEGSVLDILRTPGFMSTSSSQAKTTPTKSTVASPQSLMPAENRKQALGIWCCNTCLLENKASDTKCVACRAAKDQATEVTKQSTILTSSSKNTSPLKSVQGFGDQFKVAPGTWDCDTCLVQNKPESSKCVACETPKPATQAKATLLVLPTTKSDKSAASSNNGLSLSPSLKFEELARKPIGSWECSVCLVQNKAEDNKCVACSSAKLGVSTAVAAVPLPLSTSDTQGSLSLLDKFKKPTGSWDCYICLVQNKAEDIRCVACQSAKPGTKAEPQGFAKSSFSSESSFPTFKFGLSSGDSGELKSSSSIQSSTNTASFSFKVGESTKTSDQKKDFTFGTATGTSNTAAAPFKFGFTSSSSSEKDSTVKPTSDFQFGIPISKSESSSSASILDQAAKEKTTAPSIGLKESEEKKNETPVVTGFTFGKAEQNAASLIAFGKKDDKTDTVTSTTSLFGSTNEGEPAKTFVFGKTEPAKAENSALSSFAFGNPKPQEKKEADQTTKPMFTFGLSATDAGSSNPVFGFQGSGSSVAPQSGSTGSSSNVFGSALPASSSVFGSAVQLKTTAPAAAPTPSNTSFSSSLTAPSGSSNMFGSALSSNTPAASSNIFGSAATSGTQTSTTGFGSVAPVNTSSSSNVFGSAAPATTSTSSSSVFGSAIPTSTSTSSSNLFGIAASASTSTSSSSLFGNASASGNPSTTAFVFGQPMTTASDPLFGSGNESKSTFVFSAQESKLATTSASTAPAAAAAPPFLFSATPSTPAATGFNFGSNTSNSTGTNSAPFIFGAAPVPTGSGLAAASPVPTFGKSAGQIIDPTFGSSASNSLFPSSSQTVPAFGSLPGNVQAPSFGQQSSQPAFGSNPAPSAGPAFQFGNANFNFGAGGNTAGVFTFGSNSGANPTQPANTGFAFGQSGAFNMGANGKTAASSSISNRKIKTARRRK